MRRAGVGAPRVPLGPPILYWYTYRLTVKYLFNFDSSYCRYSETKLVITQVHFRFSRNTLSALASEAALRVNLVKRLQPCRYFSVVTLSMNEKTVFWNLLIKFERISILSCKIDTMWNLFPDCPQGDNFGCISLIH